MRSIQWAVAALALSGLTGCFNTEPELYRVALAARPATLAANCYRSGQAPSTIPDQTTNTVQEADWVLWEGVDEVRYLDAGTATSNIGMADYERVNIPADAIEGKKNEDGKYVFTVERTQRDADETYVTAATITLEELGMTLEGTVSYRSQCTGAGCPFPQAAPCEWSRRVVGRRIDGERFINAGSTN